jgi:hypothetical protein
MTQRKRQGNAISKNARNRRNRNTRNNRNRISNNATIHFSRDTETLAQAITNPFDDAAIGAVIPDQWSPPTIPALDRLTITLDPSLIVAAAGTNAILVQGWIIAFVPRSLSAGWLARANTGTVEDPSYSQVVNIVSVDSSFSRVQEFPATAEMYSLFVGIIGISGNIDNGNSITVMAYDPADQLFVEGFMCIPFSRGSALSESCSGGRICGAGLKVFSDEAPIETGGTVYGGWTAIDDLFKLVFLEPIEPPPPPKTNRNQRYNIPIPIQPTVLAEYDDLGEYKGKPHGRKTRRRSRRYQSRVDTPLYSAATFQDALKYRHAYKGVDGVTVRYSPLQSAIMEEFRPIYEDAMFIETTISLLNPDTAITINEDIAVGAHDLINPNDYVPCVVWRYNSSAGATPTENIDKTYSLRVEARVHLQCEPDGDCPFMATTVQPDPHYIHLQMLLENKDAFPVVSKGQSFKSFNAGIREAVKTVGSALNLGKDIKSIFA